MSISGSKRQTIFLVVACIGLLVLSCALFWNYGLLQLQVHFAGDQTRMIQMMRAEALQGGTANAADCLGVVVYYYPSGTKQATGSRLDRIVERERALAARDIIAYLRSKTGEDLGDNAYAWIKKYGTKL